MAQVLDHVVIRCASCREPLTGRYCARCGEKVLEPDALTVRHFIRHTLGDELVHVDGKFWQTLRSLVLRPGFLAEEHAAGRRRPYVSPVRLLIGTIITYLVLTQGGLLVSVWIGPIVLSTVPTAVPANMSVAETARQIDRFGILARMLAAQRSAVDTTSEAARERFHAKLNQFAQPLSFANVVLLALTLYALFRRTRPLLLDHAVFSAHFVSFVLVSSLAILPVVWTFGTGGGATRAVILSVTTWQFAYLAIALRRFYPGSDRRARTRMSACAAALLLYIVNSAFITAVQLIGGAVALRSI